MMNKPSIENIPEIRIKPLKFKIHNKEVYLVILEDYKYFLDVFFDDLNRFENFEESRKKLVMGIMNKMNIPTSFANSYTDDYILNNLIVSDNIFRIVEELHMTYLRDNKIDNIIK